MSVYSAGNLTAAVGYTYDVDSNRVKTVVNGTTVTYIGNYFEWSNNVGTKYYYAGSVRVGEMLLQEVSMSDELSASARRVQDALHASGFDFRVVELPASTRTAKEAAEAIGCQVAQIVKSLVFRGSRTDSPLLVIASGVNRVNEALLSSLAGEPIEKADADFVRSRTGFAIGGVPPLGHTEKLMTFIDEDLLQYEEVWAAAGTPHAVFCLHARDLERMCGGKVVKIQ